MIRLAPYAIACAVVVATYHLTPVIGPGARIERLRADRDDWKIASTRWEAAAKAWEGSFRSAEKLRSAEQVQARAAVDAEVASCDARVRQARASAKVIKEIVNAPVRTDPAGCPVRGIVGADRLRDALQPKAR